MSRKKKRRKVKKKTGRPKAFYFLFWLFLSGGIALGLFLYLYPSNSGPANSRPLYEETYLRSTELHDRIRLIDHIIYECLYKNGVEESEVFFVAVRPKKKGHHEWEFTELIIRLKDKDSMLRLERAMNDALIKFRPKIDIQNQRLSGRERVCNMYSLGLYTHKVRLIKKEDKREKSHDLPKIAIIIDDMGYNKNLAYSFMDMNLPLCFSVLPLAPYTETIVAEARKRGRELLLHLPMEPKGYPGIDPGPGALLMDMEAEEVKTRVDYLVKKIPGLKGVNHHMGSSYTERLDKMEIILKELKKRNLFYVDSRTTNRTVAFEAARKLGVPVAKKNLFLDHEPSPHAIRLQMERLLGIARYSGTAVGIGHPQKETLGVIYEYLEKLKNDFEVVPVSELVS